MTEPATYKDKFIAMVTAKAEVNLRLSDYQPRSMLVTPVHDLKRAKFPVIDYHNHLDAQDPAAVLKVMDECGIERIVNITMQVGTEALAVIQRFHSSAAGRFATYAWMDWTDLNTATFFSGCADRLEKMVEHGACGLKVWKDLGTTLRDSTGTLLRVDDERLAPMFEKAADNTAHPYAVTHPAHAGAQRTHAADDQVNFHSGLRGAIQGHDDVFIEQGIHLGDNAGGTSVTRMLGFALDQAQASFRQIQRRHQQRFIVGMLGICGEKTEDVMHRSVDFRIGGQQTQIGVDARRACVVIPRPQVGVAAGHAVGVAANQ